MKTIINEIKRNKAYFIGAAIPIPAIFLVSTDPVKTLLYVLAGHAILFPLVVLLRRKLES